MSRARRATLLALALAAVIALLFTVVFPWAETWTGPLLPFTDVTVTP